jgi:hypothetical protein
VTLLESVRTWLLTYSELDVNAGFLVEQLSGQPTQYALVPLSGNPIVETYVNGATLRQFPFAVQSLESTADDLARIAASGFYEGLSEWIETQNAAGTLPTLDDGKTPESVEPLGLPILIEFGESGVGIYQLQCRLTYEQSAME